MGRGACRHGQRATVQRERPPGRHAAGLRSAGDAKDTNLASVARRLGANTLLEGSLQRENDSFRITYRLVDVSGAQIAATSLDGEELFDLQDRIAEERGRGPRAAARRAADADTVGTRHPGARRNATSRRSACCSGTTAGRASNEPSRSSSAWRRRSPTRRWSRRPSPAPTSPCIRSRATSSGPGKAIAADRRGARLWIPSSPKSDVTLGDTLRITGQYREAMDAYRRALSVRPGDVQALLGLGRAAAAAGDEATAETAFEQALELQPSWYVFNRPRLPLLRARPLRRSRRPVSARRPRPRRTAPGRRATSAAPRRCAATTRPLWTPTGRRSPSTRRIRAPSPISP